MYSREMLSIEIEGNAQLLEDLYNLDIEGALERWIKKSMLVLESNTKRNTPVDTWLLRNSFETTFPWKLEWVLNNFREYALYVQEWTKYFEWRDFLGKGIEASERKIESIFNSEIDLLLNSLV